MSTADRPEPTAADDSLQGELAYLARFLGDRPCTAPIVLRRLGELGDDARIDLARLRTERAVRLRRMPPRSRRQRAAARVAAVMAFVVTGPSLIAAPAVAQEPAPAPVIREAALPAIVLRVIDTGSGKPLAGVKVKTVAEEVVAVTDGGGKAMVPAPYAKETVLSLEHEGYPIVLVEGEKLAARSMIAMRKFADPATASRGPAAPARTIASKGGRAAAGPSRADDPAERLMAIALEHTRSRPIAEPQALAAAPEATPAKAPVAPKAEAVIAKAETVAAKGENAGAKPETVVAKPETVVAKVGPVIAKAETVVAKVEPVTAEAGTTVAAAAPAVAKTKPMAAKAEPKARKAAPAIAAAAPAPAAAPLTPMERAARAPKRVVKVARGDAKAARSVAVAWTAPRDRADKNIAKVAFADAKAPRAIRVVMRKAVPGAAAEPESPLGITAEQLTWIPPVPAEHVAGAILPAAEAPAEPVRTAAGPAAPVEAGGHISEPAPATEGLPFLIGRPAGEAPIAEPAFPIDPEALEPHGPSVHHAPAPKPAPATAHVATTPAHHAAAPAHAEAGHAPAPFAAPIRIPANLHLPIAPQPAAHQVAALPAPAAPAHHEPLKAPVPPHVAMASKPAPAHHAAAPTRRVPPAHVAAARKAAAPQADPVFRAPAPTADLHGAAPVKHVAPPKAPSADLAFLPVAPKAPAHLAPKAAAPVEAPELLSPEEGVRRFATINLPVRPRFAAKPAHAAPHHVASAPGAEAASPMARVRAKLTASREHMRYQVKAGDMLSTIAQRELGSAALWPVLYYANRDQLTNPRWLQVGLNIKIPRTSTGIAAAGAKTYVVQAGDCLSTIAREHLGDMRKWPQIFAANRHMIKNPWLIFPGQRLVLPVYVASGVAESWGEIAATADPPADGPKFAGGSGQRYAD